MAFIGYVIQRLRLQVTEKKGRTQFGTRFGVQFEMQIKRQEHCSGPKGENNIIVFGYRILILCRSRTLCNLTSNLTLMDFPLALHFIGQLLSVSFFNHLLYIINCVNKKMLEHDWLLIALIYGLIGLLQQTITWYNIRHAGGQALYFSGTGTSKQSQVKLHWFRLLCSNVPVRE